MTLQEIFDKVWAHAASTPGKSVEDDGMGADRCLYRGPGGLKCFMGALLPDELCFENASVANPQMQPAREYLGNPPSGFLVQLQAVHDVSHYSQWEAELRRIAAHWILKAPETPLR